MRKDRKEQRQVQLAHIEGWHHCTEYGINYAHQGFKANKYFTSDRYITLDEHFNRPDGKALKGFGLEIETECHSITDKQVLAEIMDKVVFAQFPADLFKMQSDVSLAGDTSVECITQVMTKEFIRNQYAAFKTMYDGYYPAMKLVCGASCGMHCNISNSVFGTTEKAQQEAIKKLLYITNKHYELMCALTTRDRNHTRYCEKMYGYTTMDGAKNADLYHMNGSHGNCFNGSHYPEGRIELRIVGGQRTFGSFRNTMESIFHLCDAVKRLSWNDCDDIVKIFSGCNRYVWDRLNTKCREAGAITETQLAAIRETVDMETRYL